MKRGILNILLVAVSIIAFNACENDYEDYSSGDIWISMGLVETNTMGYDFVIYCDNGDTLLPAVNAASNFETYNQQRVIANYTILDNVDSSAQLYYAQINNLYEVLYKDIIELTSSNADSLGNDPVQIQDIWVVKNMLNIEFQYLGNNKTHYINLAYTTNENGEIEKPVELEFRHNANDDDEALTLDGIVTFKLDKLQTDEGLSEGENSFDFSITATNYQDEEQTFTGTFDY